MAEKRQDKWQSRQTERSEKSGEKRLMGGWVGWGANKEEEKEKGVRVTTQAVPYKNGNKG